MKCPTPHPHGRPGDRFVVSKIWSGVVRNVSVAILSFGFSESENQLLSPPQRALPPGKNPTKTALPRPRTGGAAAKKIATPPARPEQAGYKPIGASDHLLGPESGGPPPPIEILE